MNFLKMEQSQNPGELFDTEEAEGGKSVGKDSENIQVTGAQELPRRTLSSGLLGTWSELSHMGVPA